MRGPSEPSSLFWLSTILVMFGSSAAAEAQQDVGAEEATEPEVVDEETTDEKVADEELASEQVANEEVASGEAAGEQVANEEAASGEAAGGEAASGEAAGEQVANEEAASGEAVSDGTARSARPGEILPGLVLHGYVQPQVRWEERAPGDDEDRFVLEVRRGILVVDYAVELAELLVVVDMTNRGILLKDAVAALVLPTPAHIQARIKLGMFVVPFGFDLQYSAADRAFPERSILSRRFFPGERDMGLAVEGSFGSGFMFYQVALQNGVVRGEALGDPLALPDPSTHKQISARVGMQLGPVMLAIDGLWGQGFRPAAEEDIGGPEEGFAFDRWAGGLELRLVQELPVVGPLELTAEVVAAENLARLLPSDYPRLGPKDSTNPGGPTAVDDRLVYAGYASLMQRLGEYVGISARYSEYRPDDEPDIRSVIGALHVFPAEPLRIMVAYEHHPKDRLPDFGWLRMQARF